MLKHVLVPLDGSPLAELALPKAIEVAAPGGRVTLLLVIDIPQLPISGYDLLSPSSPWTSETTIKEIVERSRSYLEAKADIARQYGLHATVLVEYGDPAATVVAVARDRKVDAIVMSTHGRSGIQRWLFGSVTRRVLEVAPCPVYVIPAHEPVELEPKMAQAG